MICYLHCAWSSRSRDGKIRACASRDSAGFPDPVWYNLSVYVISDPAWGACDVWIRPDLLLYRPPGITEKGTC